MLIRAIKRLPVESSTINTCQICLPEEFCNRHFFLLLHLLINTQVPGPKKMMPLIIQPNKREGKSKWCLRTWWNTTSWTWSTAVVKNSYFISLWYSQFKKNKFLILLLADLSNVILRKAFTSAHFQTMPSEYLQDRLKKKYLWNNTSALVVFIRWKILYTVFCLAPSMGPFKTNCGINFL